MSEPSNGSWHNVKVRDKNGRKGVVVDDENGNFHRYLDIVFEDGEKITLKLNNTRANPEDPLGIEWEYKPGHWGRISI